jgi:hypothetical protein
VLHLIWSDKHPADQSSLTGSQLQTFDKERLFWSPAFQAAGRCFRVARAGEAPSVYGWNAFAYPMGRIDSMVVYNLGSPEESAGRFETRQPR